VYRTEDGEHFEPVITEHYQSGEILSKLDLHGDLAFDNLLVFDREHGLKFPPYYCTFFQVLNDSEFPYGAIVINKNPRPRKTKIIRSSDGILWEEKPDQDRHEVTFESNMPSYDPFIDRHLLFLRLWDPPKKPVSGWRKVLLSELVNDEKGERWTQEELILEADEEDGPAADIYFIQVSRYADRYIGIPAVYQRAACLDPVLRGTIHGQLATSPDGRKWKRVCQGEQFLSLGEPGTWNSGMVCPICGPYIIEGRLIYYYSGQLTRHDEPTPENHFRGCGLAWLRVDGFTSLDAGPDVGTMLTVPFWPRGKYLYINADASGGEVRVEVLQDYTYVELKDYERGEEGRGLFRVENCIPLKSDSTRHRVEWKNGENFVDLFPPGWNSPGAPEELEGRLHFSKRAIALKFYLTNAKLYSFWFVDEENPIEEGRLVPVRK
jgi:hypothetical protein